MGSRVFPSQSPPHSNPASRKVAITAGSMLPAVPCGFVSGFRSIAIPQAWVGKLGPRALRTEREASAEASDFVLQSAALNLDQTRC